MPAGLRRRVHVIGSSLPLHLDSPGALEFPSADSRNSRCRSAGQRVHAGCRALRYDPSLLQSVIHMPRLIPSQPDSTSPRSESKLFRAFAEAPGADWALIDVQDGSFNSSPKHLHVGASRAKHVLRVGVDRTDA